MVRLFANKASLQEGREAYYGVRFVFDTQNFHLPLAHASLDGYKREDPDSSRELCTWEAVCLSALQVLELPDPEAPLAAAAILIDFDVCARPGALCGLQCRSFISLDKRRWCRVCFLPIGSSGARVGHKTTPWILASMDVRASRSGQGFGRDAQRTFLPFQDLIARASAILRARARACRAELPWLHATLPSSRRSFG